MQMQKYAKTTTGSGKWLSVGLGLLAISTAAYAADPLGDGMCKLVDLLTGKYLFGIAILATLGGGSVVLFGGEISDGLKKLVTIITIVGMILGMAGILALLYSFKGTC